MGKTGKGDWKEKEFKFLCYRVGDACVRDIQVEMLRRQVDGTLGVIHKQ